MEGRRNELQHLKLRVLTKHAEDAGLPDEGIEQAMDSSDPKSALIELILSSPDVNSSATGPVVPEGVPPS